MSGGDSNVALRDTARGVLLWEVRMPAVPATLSHLLAVVAHSCMLSGMFHMWALQLLLQLTLSWNAAENSARLHSCWGRYMGMQLMPMTCLKMLVTNGCMPYKTCKS